MNDGGYRRPRRIYKLVFEQPELNGLVVRAAGVPLGKMLELTQLAGLAKGSLRPEDMDRIRVMFETFAGALVDWNLQEEDGSPVPATLTGVYSQDMEFVLEIILAWMDAVAGVPAPLERKSSGGVPSLEASLPMETLSPSPAL